MIAKEQALLAKVLDVFAQKFDKQAVLRGGMVLRILGSPRFTNDLDYVFVPYRSKKIAGLALVSLFVAMSSCRYSRSSNGSSRKLAHFAPLRSA